MPSVGYRQGRDASTGSAQAWRTKPPDAESAAFPACPELVEGWAGCTGRPGYSMSKGLTPALAAGASVAHVSDVVNTERSTNVRL